MGGSSLGSYDLLSTTGAGSATFLARRRGYADDRLFALRLVDNETASWAMSKVGCGWFPNLGPLVEVGRDGDVWFVVADVSHCEVAETAPRTSRRGGVALAAALIALLAASGAAWAYADEPGAAPIAAEISAPAIASEPPPIEAAAAVAPRASAGADLDADADLGDAEPERNVSRRILRARARQAAERAAAAERELAAIKRKAEERRARKRARARERKSAGAGAGAGESAGAHCPRTGKPPYRASERSSGSRT